MKNLLPAPALIFCTFILLISACSGSNKDFETGLEAFRNGNYLEAEEAFTNVLQQDPEDADAYNNRALARLELGKHTLALQDANIAIGLNQGDEEFFITRSTIHLARNNYEEARKDATRAVELKQDLPYAWYLLGTIKLAQNNYSGALNDLEKALRHDGSLREARLQIPVVYIMQGKYDKGIRLYEEYLSKNPPEADIYRNLGYARMRQGNYQAAVKAIENAREMAGQQLSPADKNNLGFSYYMVGDTAQGAQLVQQSLEADPANPEAWYHLAVIEQKSGNIAAACDYLAHVNEQNARPVILQEVTNLRSEICN